MKLVVATLKELELMWKKIKQKEEKKAQKKEKKEGKNRFLCFYEDDRWFLHFDR